MTTPVQPDTGAGAAPDTGSAPEPTPTDQQPPESATDETDYQAEAEKWKAQARKHEDRAKASKRELDALRTKATPAEGEPSVDDLKRQLTEHQEAREAAEARAAELAYGNTVNRVAGTLNLDAEALLDSNAFRDAVAEEVGEDFTDAELKAAVTKVAKQFGKNPRFSKQLGAARSGGEFPGGPSSPASIDQQIAAAEKNGDLRTAIALKRRRANVGQ